MAPAHGTPPRIPHSDRLPSAVETTSPALTQVITPPQSRDVPTQKRQRQTWPSSPRRRHLGSRPYRNDLFSVPYHHPPPPTRTAIADSGFVAAVPDERAPPPRITVRPVAQLPFHSWHRHSCLFAVPQILTLWSSSKLAIAFSSHRTATNHASTLASPRLPILSAPVQTALTLTRPF